MALCVSIYILLKYLEVSKSTGANPLSLTKSQKKINLQIFNKRAEPVDMFFPPSCTYSGFSLTFAWT